MAEEPLSVKLKRQRRAEGKNWKPEDETAWKERFPNAEPEPWMAGREGFNQIRFDDDLIPKPEYSNGHEPTPGERAVDAMTIRDAYVRWSGKTMVPVEGKRKEGIKISCPIPGHEDKDPSAWYNSENGQWFCGPCQKGGDKFTIAGYHFGIEPQSKDFPELKRRMAEDLGYTDIRTPAGKVIHVEPEPEPDPVQHMVIPDNLAALPHIAAQEDDDDDGLFEIDESDTYIDWKALFPDDTFMYEWLMSTTINDSPDEFFVWLGFQAMAAAAGRRVRLVDFQDVRPNLFVCLYGASGTKKSLATTPYINLIRSALPYDRSITTPSDGVDILGDVGSTEYFMESLTQKIDNGSGIELNHSKNSLWPINELSSFFGRSAKQSTNQLKEKLMELYDSYQDSIIYNSLSRSVEVKEPFFQALSTTQPNAIRAYMDKSDIFSGFLNRWIFAYGPMRHEPISHGGIMPDITVATDLLVGLHSWCLTERKMFLHAGSPEFKVWDSFFKNELDPWRRSTQDDIYNRIDLQLKKIILLLCINEKLSQPTPEIIEKAIQFFRYLKATYGMFSKAVVATDYSECGNEILDILRKHRGDIDLSISKLANRMTRYPRDIVIKTLEQLEKLELVKVDAVKSDGQAQKRYAINK